MSRYCHHAAAPAGYDSPKRRGIVPGHRERPTSNRAERRRGRSEGNVQWNKKLKLPCKSLTWPISPILLVLVVHRVTFPEHLFRIFQGFLFVSKMVIMF